MGPPNRDATVCVAVVTQGTESYARQGIAGPCEHSPCKEVDGRGGGC